MKNTRNLCVIASVDSGKTAISSSFFHIGGLIHQDDVGIKLPTDHRDDEKERGITIKSTGVSINAEHKGTSYAINLVDSPGHVDFSSEVTAAIRITDGALLVVDCVEGVCVQTETVLRQALAEKVKPILILNKLDRYFFELKLSGEEAYERLARIVANLNGLLQTYADAELAAKWAFDPGLGNVLFTSAVHGWGFSLDTFADWNVEKKGRARQRYIEFLWHGFVDVESQRTFTKFKTGRVRAFAHFIYDPMYKYIHTTVDSTAIVDFFLLKKKLWTCTTDEEKGKARYRAVFRKAFSLSDSLLSSIVTHLPSPVEAQAYRASILYANPTQESETFRDIVSCDPDGKLVVYISKMFPADSGSKFYALARIFSGTLRPGITRVKVLGANYDTSSNSQVYENKSVSKLVRVVGAKLQPVDVAVAGQIVALVGIDQWLQKSGTLLDHDATEVVPINTMKFSVNPVVHVSVRPEQATDIKRLNEGLKRLSKSDPSVRCYTTKDTKEQIIAGVGELHLEICIKDLQDFMNGAKVVKSDPIVPLKETCTTTCSESYLAKSTNKLNRLWMTAQPLGEDLVHDIEKSGHSTSSMSGNCISSRTLIDRYKWDATDAKKIWAFDEEHPTNVLVDMSRGVQYLNEVRESIIAAFHEVCRHGPLAGEPLRGVRFNVVDAQIHPDSLHRNAAQIGSAAQNVMMGCMLQCNPRLVEPFYSVQVQIPSQIKGTIYSTLLSRRGRVVNEEVIGSTPICSIQGFIPVFTSFGLDSYLKSETSGKAFLQLVVSHWETIQNDTLDKTLQTQVRVRKHLKSESPQATDYLDRL